MQIFSNIYNIGMLAFTVLLVYLTWRNFLGKYKHEKIFDFSLMFILCGILTDRVMFVIENWANISGLSWSVVNYTNTLPGTILNLDSFTGFSFVYFLLGGLLGLTLYNWINTTHKIEYDYLDRFIRLVIISFAPLLILGILGSVFGSSFSDIELSQLLPFLIRTFGVIILLSAYRFFENFWSTKNGLYTSVVLLLFTIGEIFIVYLDPSFESTVLGLINTEQLVGLLLIILSINLLLTSIATIQDQNIRRKQTPMKQTMNKGFAISFANKRRISNPINLRIKNITHNAYRSRKSRES